MFMRKGHPKLQDVLPELHRTIKSMFESLDASLSEQVDTLRIIQLCECAMADCGSFWTIEPPIDDSDDIDLNVVSYRHETMLVEVYSGVIGYVEITPSEFGREIRNKLREALGSEQ
jgi:hypothetical protein